MNTTSNILSSTLASSLRLWRGTWGKLPAQDPKKLLVLYDREDDAECRLVREALTELGLEAQIYPCPAGGKRFAERRKKISAESKEGPLLHDPNTAVTKAGANAIISYLFVQYLGKPPPPTMKASLLNLLGSMLANLARGTQEISAQPSHYPKKSLVLYSFESSPFSRLVREKLCALELPYHLINLGKLQWSDMGPAKMHLSFGRHRPTPGSKRDAFFQEHGKVQVPFLIDPNHGVKMFESEDIVAYLEERYAKA